MSEKLDDAVVRAIDRLFGDTPKLPLRDEAMFAEVTCSNGHRHFLKAAIYDPETGMSVWGSAMDDCDECLQMDPDEESHITVLKYYVGYAVHATNVRPT